MGRKILVDIEARLKHDTEKAYLLITPKGEVWVPKSQVENNEDGTFTMPEWLAIEKELI